MSISPPRSPHPSRKSFTGNHYLLDQQHCDFVHPTSALDEPGRSGLWTIGRGTVIWRIWPAVLMHTLFAAAIVVISDKTPYNLAIPNSLLIVIGVVIGFVIAYRASSGYDRYSQGCAMWADVIKNARTMSRLVWLHVPPKLTTTRDATVEEVKLALAEKKAALGLIEAFAVALKHHLRSEPGPYYTDLYHLLLPIRREIDSATATVTTADAWLVSSPPPTQGSFAAQDIIRKRPKYPDPPTSQPPLSYGTVDVPTEGQPLLPSARHHHETIPQAVSVTFIPFYPVFIWLWGIMSFRSFRKPEEVEQEEADARKKSTPYSHRKHQPKVAGGGANLPLEIVRTLSEWLAVLDARGTGGSALGGMMGCLQGFENALTDLERLLTTPLPVIYSAHLRHTVWLYLLFLPQQLVEPLAYLTILAVAIAAFLYLGFLAAGEEIEQPFGYEENDLDLDLLIRAIIHVDIDALLGRSAPNSYAALKPKDAGDASEGTLADACKIRMAAKSTEAHTTATAQATTSHA